MLSITYVEDATVQHRLPDVNMYAPPFSHRNDASVAACAFIVKQKRKANRIIFLPYSCHHSHILYRRRKKFPEFIDPRFKYLSKTREMKTMIYIIVLLLLEISLHFPYVEGALMNLPVKRILSPGIGIR